MRWILIYSVLEATYVSRLMIVLCGSKHVGILGVHLQYEYQWNKF